MNLEAQRENGFAHQARLRGASERRWHAGARRSDLAARLVETAGGYRRMDERDRAEQRPADVVRPRPAALAAVPRAVFPGAWLKRRHCFASRRSYVRPARNTPVRGSRYRAQQCRGARGVHRIAQTTTRLTSRRRRMAREIIR